MGQVLVFTSGKGGVGKTTIAANLAYCLALQNRKVALVDFDVGLRNLDIVMGVEHKVVYHIGDVLHGICRLKQALIKDNRCNNLFFLPGILGTGDELDLDGVDDIIHQLREDFDFVILDSPAGMESGFKSALKNADEVYLIVNPEMCSVRDASRVIDYVMNTNQLPIRLIINRSRKYFLSKKHYFSTKDIEDMLLLDAFGEIPNDDQIVYFINKGDFVVEHSLLMSKAFQFIGKKIIKLNGEPQLC